MEEEISLIEILDILRKNLGKIIGITLAAIVLAVVATLYVITPQYQSGTQLLVNQPSEQNTLTTGAIQTSTQLISTYREIVLSQPIIEETLNEMDVTDLTVEEARERVEVTSNSDSQIFTIGVESPDPEFTADFANGLADTFSENIEDIFEVDNVSIISTAEVPQAPSSPNLLLNTAIAALLGLGLAVLLIFIQEALDTTIKDEEFFAELELLTLGGVHKMSKKDKEKAYFLPSPQDQEALAEQDVLLQNYLGRTRMQKNSRDESIGKHPNVSSAAAARNPRKEDDRV